MKLSELKVLVIEDDDFQRKTAMSMLRTLGVESIFGAGNGREALGIIRSLKSTPVNVAICDLNMPEMDGMEFLRHLSSENRNIAIIIASVVDAKLLTSVGRMARMFGIKLLGLVEKPIMLARLRELLLKYDDAGQEQRQPGIEKEFSLEDILQGICKNQFEPYFQPKVDLKAGRLVGAEALARWVNPEHGVIGPGIFIPLLEQSGNIDNLTFIMLEKSAAACRSFHDMGHILTISVNLSLLSLDDPALADKITQVVHKAGIEPQYIVLEITESAAMTDIAHALENLARLCMNGFTLSIDDYGTGYSSLQQLTRIAFGELKIDQSFVKDFSDNKALRIVVESSIDMAHKLQVKSVAEGAETQQDWDALRSVGCDTAQGYFIAKPMNLTEFYGFIKNYSFEAAAVQPPAAPGQGGIKVLVIDDNNFTRKIVLRVLDGLGFRRIADTDSAESAMKLLEADSFDLIITDIHMPGLSGLEFAQMIRMGRTHAQPDTRIIVLTQFSQMEVLGTALALDINGFLVKPIVPSVADEKIGQALSEPLSLRPPLAYEAIRTELRSLPKPGIQPPAAGPAAITIEKPQEQNINKSADVFHQTIRSLRPGMMLNEDIFLSDGTLLMSAGHMFSQLSINRLNDLRNFLPKNSIAIQKESLAS